MSKLIVMILFQIVALLSTIVGSPLLTYKVREAVLYRWFADPPAARRA